MRGTGRAVASACGDLVGYFEWGDGAYPPGDFALDGGGELLLLGVMQGASGFDGMGGVHVVLDGAILDDVGPTYPFDVPGHADLVTATASSGAHTVGLRARDDSGVGTPPVSLPNIAGSIAVWRVTPDMVVHTWPSNTFVGGEVDPLTAFEVTTGGERLAVLAVAQVDFAQFLLVVDGVELHAGSGQNWDTTSGKALWDVPLSPGTHTLELETNGLDHAGTVVAWRVRPACADVVGWPTYFNPGPCDGGICSPLPITVGAAPPVLVGASFYEAGFATLRADGVRLGRDLSSEASGVHIALQRPPLSPGAHAIGFTNHTLLVEPFNSDVDDAGPSGILALHPGAGGVVMHGIGHVRA